MTLHRKKGIAYYTFPVLDQIGVNHGVFMRHGGISPSPWSSLNLATSVGDTSENVIENRRRITKTIGRGEMSIFDVWQVHSNKVSYSDQSRALNIPHKKADAILTDNPKVTLMMLFADCVPILLYEPENNVAGIAHAGWQGTANRVVKNTVEKMVAEHGCKRNKIIACIGPSIRIDHYQVGENVLDAMRKSFRSTKRIIYRDDGKYYLDLQVANRILLEETGVIEIFDCGICTAENVKDWFSHRAEKGETGRFAVAMTCERVG